MTESEKLLRDVKKDFQKQTNTMSSVAELMEDAHSGLNIAGRSKILYGIDAFSVSDTERKLSLYRTEDLEKDAAVRDAIRKNQLQPASVTAVREELAFREKQQSYKQKERDQEKAAGERMKDLTLVNMGELSREMARLTRSIGDHMNETDTFAMAKRTYEIKYLAAIRDLIKTQNSKGSVFGNFKSHMALAKEKYYFYRDHADRIIGSEMTAALMSRGQYRPQLDRVKQAEAQANGGAAPDFDLTKLFEQDQDARATIDGLDKKEREQLRKAILEYRESSARAYELRCHLRAIAAVDEEEKSRRVQAIFQQNRGMVDNIRTELLNRKGPGAQISDDEIKAEIAQRIVQPETASAQKSYADSVEAEIRSLKFHADASLLCLRLLLGKNDPDAAKSLRENGDLLFVHAGYLQKHFGMDIPGANEPVRRLKAVKRIGYETDDADISDIVQSIPDQAIRREFCDGVTAKVKTPSTGFGKQQAFEEAVEDYARKKIFSDLIELHPNEDQNEMRKRCAETAYLTQPLPGIERVTKPGTTVESMKLHFLGARDQRGVFHPSGFQPVNPNTYATQILPAFDSHLMHITAINQSNDPDEIREAIRAELGMVDDAFRDVVAFMSVGQSSEIFTGKRHEEIYRNLAGFPSFMKKIVYFKDLLSRICRHPDLLSQIEQQDQIEIQESLLYKLNFINRANQFIENRILLINKGYDATLSDWSQSTEVLKGFWDGEVPSPELLSKEDEREFLGLVHGLADIERQKNAADDGANPPAGAGASLASLDALEEREKHFLRVEYYEGSLATREEQKAALEGDLLKATIYADCVASREAIEGEIEKIVNKTRTASAAELDTLRTRMTELCAKKNDLDIVIASVREKVQKRAADAMRFIKAPARPAAVAAAAPAAGQPGAPDDDQSDA